MRVGLIARADKTGLGAQTHSFWRNMHPHRTLVVDLSHCSGQAPDLSRYAGDPNVQVWQDKNYPHDLMTPHPVVEAFLDEVDVVFACETFYNNWLIQRAREKGVRTVLQPNYEFLEYLVRGGLPEPDVFALPSTWHMGEIKARLRGRDVRHLPVPVDRELLPYRRRTSFDTILHTAGTVAMEDRNGTQILVDAMRLVRSPVRAIVRSQRPMTLTDVGPNIDLDHSHVQNYWDLYDQGDLFVLPRKYGGLCLPMQEALAVGMPLITTKIDPQWNTDGTSLPPDMLVEAVRVSEFMARAMIGVYAANPADVAERIDWFYEHPDYFAAMSDAAGRWGDEHSWDALRPLYEAALEGRAA